MDGRTLWIAHGDVEGDIEVATVSWTVRGVL